MGKKAIYKGLYYSDRNTQPIKQNEMIRPMPLSIHSVTSWTSTSTDDREDPPSKTRHEATYARLWHCLLSVVHSPTQLLHIARQKFGGVDMSAHIISDSVLLGICSGNVHSSHPSLVHTYYAPSLAHCHSNHNGIFECGTYCQFRSAFFGHTRI